MQCNMKHVDSNRQRTGGVGCLRGKLKFATQSWGQMIDREANNPCSRRAWEIPHVCYVDDDDDAYDVVEQDEE